MARVTAIPLVLLLTLPLSAEAADLPAGNCAAPRALTDLSRCDFSRQKLAGKDLHGAKLLRGQAGEHRFPQG
ncbi:MAG: hypothetical protein IPL58_03575 [Betaproteobacteria bacterium]|uniref:Pentapeptide repeat-containing protein n=1 Tax=Candidatus Proximibacter danicus TaxID=2954365 RepID=A0A9D7PR08_9PROT|nr:hypothetical protein [Candidatus Proximibacter danicus]